MKQGEGLGEAIGNVVTGNSEVKRQLMLRDYSSRLQMNKETVMKLADSGFGIQYDAESNTYTGGEFYDQYAPGLRALAISGRQKKELEAAQRTTQNTLSALDKFNGIIGNFNSFMKNNPDAHESHRMLAEKLNSLITNQTLGGKSNPLSGLGVSIDLNSLLVGKETEQTLVTEFMLSLDKKIADSNGTDLSAFSTLQALAVKYPTVATKMGIDLFKGVQGIVAQRTNLTQQNQAALEQKRKEAQIQADKEVAVAERKPPTTAMGAFLRQKPNAIPEEIATFEQQLKGKGISMTLPDGTVVEMGGAGQTADAGMKELNKQMGKSLVKQREDAQGAVKALESVYEAKNLLKAGIITGTGAEWITSFGNLLSSRLGFNYGDPVANTQAFAATMGNQVGQIIKQFGAGTGLSDADREYAEKIVGGKITLNEGAIRRLIYINEKAHKNVINRYNQTAKQAKKRKGAENLLFDLELEMPIEKQRDRQGYKNMSNEELLKELNK